MKWAASGDLLSPGKVYFSSSCEKAWWNCGYEYSCQRGPCQSVKGEPRRELMSAVIHFRVDVYTQVIPLLSCAGFFLAVFINIYFPLRLFAFLAPTLGIHTYADILFISIKKVTLLLNHVSRADVTDMLTKTLYSGTHIFALYSYCCCHYLFTNTKPKFRKYILKTKYILWVSSVFHVIMEEFFASVHWLTSGPHWWELVEFTISPHVHVTAPQYTCSVR